MDVRQAHSDETAAVLSILDAALLQTDADRVDRAINRGDVLVAQATESTDSTGESQPILGTLVLNGERITAIAVRPGRRGQGIGRTLVTVALGSRSNLRAEFDPRVEPFWDALDFEIRSCDSSERLVGVRTD